MGGLMMPLISPTTICGSDGCADAPVTATHHTTRYKIRSVGRCRTRMTLHRVQLARDGLDLRAHALDGRLISRILSDRAHDLRHALHMRLASPARGDGRRPKAHAA